MMFAKIENNTVVERLRRIPPAHTFSNGDKTGNFDAMPASVQMSEGFYPLIDSVPDHDADTQRVNETDVTIEADKVVVNYEVEDIPLVELKTEKSVQIQALLEEKLQSSQFQFAGVTFNFTPSTAMDAAEFGSALNNGFPFPAMFSWTAADGSEFPMTEPQFKLFGQTVAGHKLTLVGTAKTHIATVNAAQTASAVAAYDIALGW